jgi:uncharacterized protein
MKTITTAHLDWERIAAQLDSEGYAMLPGLLDAEQAGVIAARAQDSCPPRTRLSFEALALGRGEMWRLPRALPHPLADLREALYAQLAPIANRWSETMGVEARYPATLGDFLGENSQAGEACSQSSLNRLCEGDYQALHRSAEGNQVFPLQLVALLSEPGEDFGGGEFVMTEQRPRMQSRPMVLPLCRGDAALIAVAHRPCKGSKSYYRVTLKHAISRVRSGERIGLELMFQDGC